MGRVDRAAYSHGWSSACDCRGGRSFCVCDRVSYAPGVDAVGTKYERATTRKEKALDDLQREPDSGRTLWDALDADIDPTEQYPRHTP
nr:Trp biosynthesis-associated membrane protein [Corynebacterium renale]